MIDTSERRIGPAIRRTFAALAATASATVALTGFTSTSASAAATPPPDCPSTYFCFYADPSYSGGMGKVTGDNPDFRRFTTSTHNCGNGNWDNCVSSAYNHGTSCTVYLYSGYGYTGDTMHKLSRGDGYPNLAWIGFDDRLSSNKWCNS